MYYPLIEQKIYIMDKLKRELNITKRKNKKLLWKIINEYIKNDYPINYESFFTYRERSYCIELKEIYCEEVCIKKIKPHLIRYIEWRLWNPDNGLRYLKLLDKWYNRF